MAGLSAALMLVAVTRPVALPIATHRAEFSSTGNIDIDPVMGRVERLSIFIDCTGIGLLRATIGSSAPNGIDAGRPSFQLDVSESSGRLLVSDDEMEPLEFLRVEADPDSPDCAIDVELMPGEDGWEVRLANSLGSEETSVVAAAPDTRTVSLTEARGLSGGFVRGVIAVVEVDVIVLEDVTYSASARALQGASTLVLLVALGLWWRSWPASEPSDP